MGFVWNILLSFTNDELWEEGKDEPYDTPPPLEAINAWLPFGRLVELIGPTYAPGVGNGMDANLYGGGFKHFDIESFIEVVEAQEWKDRANVQLWVKGGEEGMGVDPFTLVKLRKPKAPRKKPKPIRKKLQRRSGVKAKRSRP